MNSSPSPNTMDGLSIVYLIPLDATARSAPPAVGRFGRALPAGQPAHAVAPVRQTGDDPPADETATSCDEDHLGPRFSDPLLPSSTARPADCSGPQPSLVPVEEYTPRCSPDASCAPGLPPSSHGGGGRAGGAPAEGTPSPLPGTRSPLAPSPAAGEGIWPGRQGGRSRS